MFGKSKARKEAERKLALEEDERRWGSKVYGSGANKTLDQLVAERRALGLSGESDCHYFDGCRLVSVG